MIDPLRWRIYAKTAKGWEFACGFRIAHAKDAAEAVAKARLMCQQHADKLMKCYDGPNREPTMHQPQAKAA